MQITKKQIYQMLNEVFDTETGLSLVALGLIDDVDIKGGQATVKIHPRVPYCPPVNLVGIAMDIKQRLKNLGVNKPFVYFHDYYLAEQVNKEVNG